LGLMDADQVDLSNLQRQVIHHTSDIGRDKVISAADKMRAINPDITVNALSLRVEASNILDLIKDYDFVIDGTDNFPTSFSSMTPAYSATSPIPMLVSYASMGN